MICKLATAIAFLLILAPRPVESAVTDEQARGLATDAISIATNIPAAELNTKRREDLEDSLFGFQRKVVGHIRRGAYFYEVFQGGYHIIPTEVTYSEPSQHWVVAVCTDDGATFGLQGLKDGEENFDRLVSRLGLDVNNPLQSETFATFFLNSVFGNAGNVIYDELRLRHKVEEHFVGFTDSQQSSASKEQRYRAWWTGFKARKFGSLIPKAIEEGRNGYSVSFRILDMTIGRPPELSQWSVRVQKNGTCRLESKKRVYP